MSLPSAYCSQLDEVIDISRAHTFYFSQEEPRRDLVFLCPDEKCRNESPQIVLGVNYNKIPQIDQMVQKAHFRLINSKNHIDECPWVEIKKAIDELDEETEPKKFSNLKRSQLIDIFKPSDNHNEPGNPRIDAAQIKAISTLTTSRVRIDRYKEYLRNNPNCTSRLQEVASCFERMTPDELSITKLKIQGIGEKTYRQFFTSVKFCAPSTTCKKIYYGYASVCESHEGFNLLYRQESLQSDSQSATVNIFLPYEMIDKFRGKGVVLATLLAAKELGGNVIFCHAFGTVDRSDSDGEPRLDINLQSLHSLSLMLK